MDRRNLTALSVLAAAGIGFAAWSCMGDTSGGFDARSLDLLGGPLPGAIFTTTADGSRVNANIYEAKEDVYLDGGPGPNAPVGAAGLPAGDYYFQVTDPSGRDLLSEDHISCRRVHVNDAGVIDYIYPGTNYVRVRGQWTPVPCEHVAGTEADHADDGAITVQLMPYADTPNRGGVYKVWMTRVSDYLGDPLYVPRSGGDAVNGEHWEPGNFHGFTPSASKTDNYKVHRRGPPYVPPILSVHKWHDADLDGVRDDGEAEISGWRVTVADPVGSTNNYFTPADIFATEGLWTASEERRAGTLQTAALLDGAVESRYPTADPIVAVTFSGASGERHEIWYGNVGLGLVQVCKVYDRDADGVADADEPKVPGWTVELTGTTTTGTSVGPLVRTTGSDGCVTFADLLPGTYHVTENVPTTGGWHATGATSADATITSTLSGEGVLAGTAHDVAFTNYCTGTADFGTKGFWHNRNGLAEVSADDIAYVNGLAPYAAASTYFDAGDEPFDGHFADGTPVESGHGDSGEEAAPAGTALAEISHFLVDANAGGDPREQLAQQLLAFIFNVRHRLDGPQAAILYPDGTVVVAATLIEQAIAAWTSGTPADQTAIAQRLDTLNNSDALEFVHFNPCAVP